MKLQSLLWMILLWSASLCRGAGPAGMEDSIRTYTSDRFTLSRAYDLPWSQLRLERFDKLYRDWQARLRGIDYDALNQQGRIDYILLRNELSSELNQQGLQGERLREMDELLSFRGAIQELEAARWQMK